MTALAQTGLSRGLQWGWKSHVHELQTRFVGLASADRRTPMLISVPSNRRVFLLPDAYSMSFDVMSLEGYGNSLMGHVMGLLDLKTRFKSI